MRRNLLACKQGLRKLQIPFSVLRPPTDFREKFQPRLLGAKERFNKERFQLAENLRSAGCSPFIIFKELAVRMGKLITACARKNERTARMLAIACKDHTILFLAVHYNSLIHLEREIL